MNLRYSFLVRSELDSQVFPIAGIFNRRYIHRQQLRDDEAIGFKPVETATDVREMKLTETRYTHWMRQ